MKSDKIMEAMNDIEDKYIVEAHEPIQKQSKIKMYWKPVVISALCTCVALVVVPQVFLRLGNDSGSASYMKHADVPREEYYYEEADTMALDMNDGAMSSEKKASGSNEIKRNEKLIVTSSIDIETLDLDKVMNSIIAETKNSDGYVQYSNLYTGYTNQRIYSATVRIPADSFDLFVEKVKEMGNVTNYSQSVDDVTDSYYDVQAHIDSLRAEKERVTQFYEKAQTVEELTIVEQRLSEIEFELSSYESQLKNYDTLTNYSTLSVNVKETKIYTETKDDFLSRLGNSFGSGWSSFIEGIEMIILAIVYNLWTILFLILVGFIGYKVYKRRKNK